jgi:hypothetical protein
VRSVVVAARELTGARYAALGVLDPERPELERFINVIGAELRHPSAELRVDVASAASPITRRSPSSIARSPARITLWSSARTAVICLAPLSIGCRPGVSRARSGGTEVPPLPLRLVQPGNPMCS